MKQVKKGNPRRRSKFAKWLLEEKRMRKKFGLKSPQYQHFRAYGRYRNVKVKIKEGEASS